MNDASVGADMVEAGYVGAGAGRAWWERRRPLFALDGRVALPDGGMLAIDLVNAMPLGLSWPTEDLDEATYARLVGREAFAELRRVMGEVRVVPESVSWDVELDPGGSGPFVRAAVVEAVARWSPGPLDDTGLLIDRLVAAHAAGWSRRAARLAALVAGDLIELAAHLAAGELPATLAPDVRDGLDAALAQLEGHPAVPAVRAARTALDALAPTDPELDALLVQLVAEAEPAALVMGVPGGPSAERGGSDRLGWERDECVDLVIRPSDLPARVVDLGRPHERGLHAHRRVGASVADVWARAQPDVDQLALGQVEVQVSERSSGALLAAEPVTLVGDRLQARVFLAGRRLDEVTIALRGRDMRGEVGDLELVLAERCLYAAWWTLRQAAVWRAVSSASGRHDGLTSPDLDEPDAGRSPSARVPIRGAAQAYLSEAIVHLEAWAAGRGEQAPARAELVALFEREPTAAVRPTLAELLGAVRHALAEGSDRGDLP